MTPEQAKQAAEEICLEFDYDANSPKGLNVASIIMRHAGWRDIASVPDEIKRDGTLILVCRVTEVDAITCTASFKSKRWWVIDGEAMLDKPPTHWLPLPPPPDRGQG